MDLLSIFKRPVGASASAASTDPVDAVQVARTRARQRLIGAAVLLVIGVIGFPLLFETQPRPIPVDIPIEVPRKEGAAPLAMPPGRATAPAQTATPGSAAMPATRSVTPPSEVITESREDAGREVPPRAGSAVAKVEPSAPATPAARASAVVRPEPPPAKPTAAAPADNVPRSDAARAQALLEGSSAAPASPARFVVQVGAFADAASAREARSKVEKLGLKTYTQVASTPAGDRIRVRVGPFGQRDDADRAQAKARSAGLSAVVLTL